MIGREGVCKGAQSLLAPQSALALGRLGESESEFEHETVHITGRDGREEEHLSEESTVSAGKGTGQQAVGSSSISGTSTVAVRAAFAAVTSVATESSTAHWVTLGKICAAPASAAAPAAAS